MRSVSCLGAPPYKTCEWMEGTGKFGQGRDMICEELLQNARESRDTNQEVSAAFQGRVAKYLAWIVGHKH